MTNKTFVGYYNKYDTASLFTSQEHVTGLSPQQVAEKFSVDEDELPLHEALVITVPSWQDAMYIWHQFNGWEPYRPMVDNE